MTPNYIFELHISLSVKTTEILKAVLQGNLSIKDKAKIVATNMGSGVGGSSQVCVIMGKLLNPYAFVTSVK